MRRKMGLLRPGDEPQIEPKIDVAMIDVSDYNPPHIPLCEENGQDYPNVAKDKVFFHFLNDSYHL